MENNNLIPPVPESSSKEEFSGALLFSGCFSLPVLGAMSFLLMFSLGVMAIWNGAIEPALNEPSGIEWVNTNPKLGVVKVDRFTDKECDGTTLIYTTYGAFTVTDINPIENSSQCQ